jgi:hypothetical protein
MSTDLKSLLIANWDATIIAAGQIQYLEDCPSKHIGQGVGLIREITDHTPSGMTYKQSDFKSGDIFRVFLIDNSDTNVLLRSSALTKICNNFTGNATYDRLIPRLQEQVWDKDEDGRSVTKWRRILQMPLVCTKNNKDLFT